MGGSILPMLMGGGQPTGFGSGAQMPQNLMGGMQGKPSPMMSLGTPQSMPMRGVQMPQNLMGSPGGAGLSSPGAMGGGAAPSKAPPPMPPSRPANLNPIGGANPPSPPSSPYGGLGDSGLKTERAQTGGAPMAPSQGKERSPVSSAEFYKALIDKGFTPNAAAGLTGNAIYESGGNASTVYLDPFFGPKSGSGAVGSMQWEGEGKRGRSVGVLPTLDNQIGHIYDEISSGKQGITLDQINAAKTPGEAAHLANYKYERPQFPGASDKQRQMYAAMIAKGGPTTQMVASSSPAPQQPASQTQGSPQSPQQLLNSIRGQTGAKDKKQQPALQQPSGGGGGDKGAQPSSGGQKQQSPAEMAGNKFAEINAQRAKTGGWHAVYGNPKATIADLIKAA